MRAPVLVVATLVSRLLASSFALADTELSSGAPANAPAANARGDEGDPPAEFSGDPAAAAAAAGRLLPLSVAPRAGSGTFSATLRGGYDTAAHGAVARGSLEGALTRGLSLRLEYEHGAEVPRAVAIDRMRIGARLSLLDQASSGVDAGLAVFYDPRDFRDEGNLLVGVLAGRSFGRWFLLGNAVAGSDPEGDDQTLELRLSSSYRLAPGLLLGIDGRARRNFSSDEKRRGTVNDDVDLETLSAASWALGNLVLTADAGLRALETTGPFAAASQRTQTTLGVVTLLGAGGAF